MNIYFDNASTTLVRNEAASAMLEAMTTEYGNPSSTHFMGRAASALLENARKSVALAMGAGVNSIYFTSGGTEANNWAVLGMAQLRMRVGKHFITSAIEHDSVYETAKKLESMDWQGTYLPPDENGRITKEAFANALREDTAFASVMLVNNETGAVSPVDAFAAEIKKRGLKTLLHTDAVQGFCKIPVSARGLGADLISVSAHKLHGPKGVGALYIAPKLNMPQAQIGGSQERGIRPGTQPLPAIIGFGQAASLAAQELDASHKAVSELRRRAVSLLSDMLPEALVLSGGDCPYLLSLSLPGHKSEVLMSFLETKGICVSKSAACKKGARSRVLEAMGLKNEIVDGAIRVSFSKYNTPQEVQYFVDCLKLAAETLFKAY